MSNKLDLKRGGEESPFSAESVADHRCYSLHCLGSPFSKAELGHGNSFPSRDNSLLKGSAPLGVLLDSRCLLEKSALHTGDMHSDCVHRWLKVTVTPASCALFRELSK